MERRKSGSIAKQLANKTKGRRLDLVTTLFVALIRPPQETPDVPLSSFY